MSRARRSSGSPSASGSYAAPRARASAPSVTSSSVRPAPTRRRSIPRAAISGPTVAATLGAESSPLVAAPSPRYTICPAPSGASLRAAATSAPATSDEPPGAQRRSHARASSNDASVAGASPSSGWAEHALSQASRTKRSSGSRLAISAAATAACPASVSFDWLWLTSSTTARSRRLRSGSAAPAGHATGTRTATKRSVSVEVTSAAGTTAGGSARGARS